MLQDDKFFCHFVCPVIGTAFALDMLFGIPVWCGVLIAGLSTLVLLLLQQYGVFVYLLRTLLMSLCM